MPTVNFVLPGKSSAGQVVDSRAGRYGELYVNPVYDGMLAACDEGSYFVAVNATSGTGISGSVATAYSGTASAFIALQNTDKSGGKNLYPDYIKLICRTAPASATNWLGVIDVDTVLARFTSGGTAITPKNANLGSSNATVAALNVGALTTVALSSAGATTGRIQFRTVIPVVGDTYIITFGGVDKPSGAGVINGTNAQIITYNVPPTVVPPQGVLCLSLFGASNAITGYNAEFEIGWLER